MKFFRFANPLFDGKRVQRSPPKRVEGRRGTSVRCPPPPPPSSTTTTIPKSTTTESFPTSASLPPQFSLLETTLPDYSRTPDQTKTTTTFEFIDVSPNVSRDSLLLDSEPSLSRDSESNTQISAGGLFDDNSSSASSDIPPALPRKASASSRIPAAPQRKISQYDNVHGPSHHSPLTFAASAPFPVTERSLPSLRSVSTLSSFQVNF